MQLLTFGNVLPIRPIPVSPSIVIYSLSLKTNNEYSKYLIHFTFHLINITHYEQFNTVHQDFDTQTK